LTKSDFVDFAATFLLLERAYGHLIWLSTRWPQRMRSMDVVADDRKR
jgi:hypothetical protein